jgi:hypothetical protein
MILISLSCWKHQMMRMQMSDRFVQPILCIVFDWVSFGIKGFVVAVSACNQACVILLFRVNFFSCHSNLLILSQSPNINFCP